MCFWSEKKQQVTPIYHARIFLAQRRSMKTLTELAADLNIPYYRIKYAHLSGKLQEPEKVGGIRIYSRKMIDKVRAYFAGSKNNP